MITFSYDVGCYDFRGAAWKVFGIEDLSRLHESPVPDESWTATQREGWFLKQLYDRGAEEIRAIYVRLLDEVVKDLVGPVLYVQTRVCFRVQLPAGDDSAGRRFHCDKDWGQTPEFLNVWVPYTDVWDSNTLWLESEPGRNDHQPVRLSYGQAIVFDGGQQSHGRIANLTGFTRVSGDVRFATSMRTPA